MHFIGWILIGAVAAAGTAAALFALRRKAIQDKEREILRQAEDRADRIHREAELKAKDDLLRIREEGEQKVESLRNSLLEEEQRLRKKEDALDRKLDDYGRKERFLEKTERGIAEDRERIEAERKETHRILEEERETLRKISGLTEREARELLLERIEEEEKEAAAEIIRRTTARAEEEAKEKARGILAAALQRCASQFAAETSVSTADLPEEEMKGRVIGREGRNIRAFEKATGVDVIVNDTPGVVVLSAFDPLRREIARRAMERLIKDGRIHPARIEEVAAEMTAEVGRFVIEAGKQAALDAGVHGLDRAAIEMLGKLKFRVRNGQNVLAHSIEVAYASGTIASELGLDADLARRIGLLHDVGLAADPETEGSHAKAGAEICRRHGEKREVINAIAAHHGEERPESTYAAVLQVANETCNARPGATREHIDRHIRRMTQTEEIAKRFTGVKEAYAIQGGKGLRVIVHPEQLDDKMSARLAREIARTIEREARPSGELQVTVLREVRVKGRAK